MMTNPKRAAVVEESRFCIKGDSTERVQVERLFRIASIKARKRVKKLVWKALVYSGEYTTT